MKALTMKLLAGTGVTEETHPDLVALLELAAAGPGIAKGSALDTPALRKRLLRDWKRVCEAFRACLPALLDGDLRSIQYDFGSGGPDKMKLRAAVAQVLERVAAARSDQSREVVSR